MKKLTLLPILCCISSILHAQTITDVRYSINWQSATNAIPVSAKGIYMLVKEGLAFFDPVSAKYKLINQTDSSKGVSGLIGLAAHKDRVVVHSDKKMYLLLPNDKLKDITPNYPFGGYATLRFVSIDDNEITTTNGEKIFSYKNNLWTDMTVPNLRYSKLSKVYPAGKNYIAVNESSGELLLYSPATNSQRFLARTYQSPILFIPAQAVWFMDNTIIHYFSFANNKMLYGVYRVEEYPGKLKTNGFSKDRTFDGCRLTLNDKKEVFFISADTALQLTTSSPVDSTVRIMLQGASLKPAYPKFETGFTIYANTLYETGTTGIVRHTMQKKDTLFKIINKSIGMEGYNWMMANGYLYTKDAVKLHWNNGSNTGSKDFSKYVIDITTDGKSNFILTENILYRERSLGIFDSVASAAENSMKAVAVDKNETIWMAGHKGITKVTKGKAEFIPAASISGFPNNQAVHDIGLSPEGELFISLSKVYKYKDKVLTEVPGSPSLVYRHYFDGKGNDYMTGMGECFFYDGKEVKDMKKILQEAYPDRRSPYVGAVAIDPQGRAWTIVNFLNQKAIVVFDKGRPVNLIADDRIVLDPFKQKIYSYKQQMIIATEKGGWITLQYK